MPEPFPVESGRGVPVVACTVRCRSLRCPGLRIPASCLQCWLEIVDPEEEHAAGIWRPWRRRQVGVGPAATSHLLDTTATGLRRSGPITSPVC